MKVHNKILAAVLAACTTVLLMGAVPSELQPTNAFFVNDYANVIDEDTEQEIFALGKNLYEKSDAQVVVVTVDSLEGLSANEFAWEIGDSWKLGDQ